MAGSGQGPQGPICGVHRGARLAERRKRLGACDKLADEPEREEVLRAGVGLGRTVSAVEALWPVLGGAHTGRFVDDLLDIVQQLVEAEGLEEHMTQAGLTRLDDGVSRIVAKAGHEH